MLTGTPLDLTPIGGIVAALGWLYWIAAAGIVFVVWRAGKTRTRKLVFAGVTATLLAAPLIASTLQRMELQDRRERAMAHFQMRCKSAGEFIKRTVDNVEGVAWLKWRERLTAEDEFDQFKLTDPFGRDCTGEGCVEQLLTLPPQGGRFEREVQQRKGRYRWVETEDPGIGLKFRYRGVMQLRPMWTEWDLDRVRKETGQEPDDGYYWFKPERERIERYSARYGVTWDDISTREDREHWIAGGRLQVIDLQTNEVIAERIGYMMDRGLGSRAGFRTPWGAAKETACPPLLDNNGKRSNVGFTTRFLAHVLRPQPGE